MSDFGTITARVFTSSSMLPIEGAAVLFYRKNTAGENELLGMRVTDFDGYTDPLSVQTPDADTVSRHVLCARFVRAIASIVLPLFAAANASASER